MSWQDQPERKAEYDRIYNADPVNKARRAAVRRARHEAGRARLTAIKTSRGCADCGTLEDLEFHHRPGTVKRFNLARTATYSPKTQDDEIAKCDVLCDTCHHRRHATQGV